MIIRLSIAYIVLVMLLAVILVPVPDGGPVPVCVTPKLAAPLRYTTSDHSAVVGYLFAGEKAVVIQSPDWIYVQKPEYGGWTHIRYMEACHGYQNDL